MEIESVNNSQQPTYHTIELFVKHLELQSWNIPSNWFANFVKYYILKLYKL